MRRGILVVIAEFLFSSFVLCQQPVTIRVDAGQSLDPLSPVWAYFGYDEPNYTYMQHGRELIEELSELSPVPVQIRTHNLLTTGDGIAALKWGSTNAYTEDASGRPIYDWTIVDRILDTYLQAGAKPFLEIGFTPQAMSTHPDPYRHAWPKGELFIGWTYPPKDFQKWGELVRQLAEHSAQRYGKAEAESWYWEVWNEPDIGYWHGTPEEYNKLYDFAATAVKRVLPNARVGGPATTGPASAKGAEFLKQFLEHCARGTNSATGKPGVPLDFISFHAKGSPTVGNGHVRMGLSKNLRDVEEGFSIVAAFPQFANMPIFLTESDPEGCAACSARTNPQNAYRNGTLYPAYTALAVRSMLDLAAQRKANLQGILTWAFEFEGQPYFDGFRTLATNGVDKPILNLFRMFGLMRGDRVNVESTASLGLETIVHDGVVDKPDVDALAARSERNVTTLIWNYHDDDVLAAASDVKLNITGLPESAKRVLLRHYRIDQDHSNAYSVWKQMGSPQHPTAEEYARLKAAGELQLLESPRWVDAKAGSIAMDFSLPRQAVSLVDVSW